MKLSHKLLSGLALALAFSNVANASIVEYNYSFTSGSNTLTADLFVDDSLTPNYSLISGKTSSFTFNGTQYAVDFGDIKVDSQIWSGAQGYALNLHNLKFGGVLINSFTADYGYGFGPVTFNTAEILGNYYFVSAPGSLTKVTTPSATAVPEPEAYAMMLAGLGLVGFAARRRVS